MQADDVVTHIEALQSSYTVTTETTADEMTRVQEALAAWWEHLETEIEHRLTIMEPSDVEDSRTLYKGSFVIDGVTFDWEEQADGSVDVRMGAANINTHSVPVLQIAAKRQAEIALRDLRLRDAMP